MDIMGKALWDYYKTGKTNPVILHNSYGDPEEMPADIFFRYESEMPYIELKAIELCRGSVLDIGAGAGSHALLLQEIQKDVTAIEISEPAVQIMKERGVKKVILDDIFKPQQSRFDTLLLLMNGIGLAGTLEGFDRFLDVAESLLNPQGQLIFDSSNISYLYEDNALPDENYYGEVSYRYEYNNETGDWFNWVYIDQQTLKHTAAAKGWAAEIIYDDGEDHYLARLQKIDSSSW